MLLPYQQQPSFPPVELLPPVDHESRQAANTSIVDIPTAAEALLAQATTEGSSTISVHQKRLLQQETQLLERASKGNEDDLQELCAVTQRLVVESHELGESYAFRSKPILRRDYDDVAVSAARFA